MQWHEFIFSEKKQIRWLRHILFWISWGAYFLLCDYVFQIPNHPNYAYGKSKTGFIILGSQALIKVLLLLSIYAVACYFFSVGIIATINKREMAEGCYKFTSGLRCCFCVRLVNILAFVSSY